MHKIWIWQQDKWTQFIWDTQKIDVLLGKVRALQGELNGIAQVIGFNSLGAAVLDAETEEIIKTSEIEGIILNKYDVRSCCCNQTPLEYRNS